MKLIEENVLKKIGILHRNCDVVHIRRQHEPVIRVL